MGNKTIQHRFKSESGADGRLYAVPPDLRDSLALGEHCGDAEMLREAMVAAGWCGGDAPPIVLELYGALRLKSGCELLPLRAHRLGDAASLLLRAFPAVRRLIPDEPTLRDHYRFSLNGHRVTTDLEALLEPGDHVLLFSASVGG